VTETRSVRHSFLTNNGLRLHLLEYGGSGRPIVCLHGVTGHAWVWHDVAPDLATVGRVVSLDMRGFGDSQWPAGGEYRTEDHAGDLAATIDALGADRVDLAGSSWGALVALAYAAGNPERVNRLAVVDMQPSFTQSETDLFPRPRSFATDEEARASERQANPNAPEDMIEIMAAMGTRPGLDGQLFRKHDPVFFERWPFRSDDRWEELRSLRLPVLMVHGEQSFVQAEVMERMAKETGAGRLVHIQNSGHVVPVEQPTELAKVLVDFFGGED